MKALFTILGVVAIIAIAMMAKNGKKPKNLGLIGGRFKPLSSKPNGVSSQAEDKAKKVAPLTFFETISDTKEKIKKACEAYGGQTLCEETENYLHFVFTTETMKFKDDVEFYIDEKNHQVHYRSASRVGYSDMGVNKKRYEAIQKNYES